MKIKKRKNTETLKVVDQNHNLYPPAFSLEEYFLNNDDFKTNRRGFIKFLGLGLSAATIVSACKRSNTSILLPTSAISEKPFPGEIKWYNSICNLCQAHCPIQIKTFENRPIKIEGNNQAGKFTGGVCSSAHTLITEIYNNNRQKYPTFNQQKPNWDQVDSIIQKQLKEISDSGKKIIVFNDFSGPASRKLVSDFVGVFKSTTFLTIESLQRMAVLQANRQYFGKAIIPYYKFQKAKMIVSFGVDFLSGWFSPMIYAHQYTIGRDLEKKGKMSCHIQFESTLTLSGANADVRHSILPSEEASILLKLYNLIANRIQKTVLSSDSDFIDRFNLEQIASNLLINKGRSIIVSDSNLVSVQLIVNGINTMLENYGRTIDINNYWYRNDDFEKIFDVADDLKKGLIGAIIFQNGNPLTQLSGYQNVERMIKNLPLTISLSVHSDPDLKFCKYHCPSAHLFEGWNDYERLKGQFSISQPVYQPFYDVREPQQSLLKWMGTNIKWSDYLKNCFSNDVFATPDLIEIEKKWEILLTQGVYIVQNESVVSMSLDLELGPHAAFILKANKAKSGFEYIIYSESKSQLGLSENPWLAELPDPISKTSWNQFAFISESFAKENYLKDGDVVELSNNNETIQLAVLVQPFMLANVLAIPQKFALSNPDFFMEYNNQEGFDNHLIPRSGYVLNLGKTDKKVGIALNQKHGWLSNSEVVQSFKLSEYLNLIRSNKNSDEKQLISKVRDFKVHHWAMVIDLHRCTGCSSCVLSCQMENNIPVIGQEEIEKYRSMHWLQIARYYEKREESMITHFLPVMCQQCDNAPCEAVCPVSAVSSSSEGLNQQNYQRCIGARFCAVNCPYQTRKFNYHEYAGFDASSFYIDKEYISMFLNPEVTIREKGVVEKCTFCIQRIQQAKSKAKVNNQPLRDGDIQTACQQSCPSKAIYFGDLNDKGSIVYRLSSSKRAFSLLGQLKTKPSVIYLSKIRNTQMDV